MATNNDFPLITDLHAPTRHPDTESVSGGDYYTPSKTRQHYNKSRSSSVKKRKHNGKTGESESIISSNAGTAAAVEYRGEYRKDREEWSDTAISCLLEAYREKYEEVNRGNLRGRDWEEVAEAVNERGGGGGEGYCGNLSNSNKKSVEQCKNKIDNLKKRYKVELQRINSNNNNNNISSSNWHWFKHIEMIMGNSCNNKCGVGGEMSEYGGGENANMVARPLKRCTPSNVTFTNHLKAKSVPNLKWRRVLFKISGAALAGNCENIDPKVAMQIAKEVATACRLGLEVAIIVGGRNFFCKEPWISAIGLDRPMAYQISTLATVMNSILLQSALEDLGVQARVQSAFAMPDIVEPYSRQRAIRHLDKGRVVIFGGTSAGAGSALFTSDTAAALRASEINAEALLKGTNVDGVYDCHSGNNNVILDRISFREVVSRGITFMDTMAVTYCEENDIPVVVFNLLEPGNVSRALCGDQVGTLIDQTGGIS